MQATLTAEDTKRILIVEDELLVRMFAVDCLEDAGYAVVQAGSAAEALSAFNSAPHSFACVVVDLGLPDRPGDHLAAELRAHRTDLPIVIASGRSEREIRDRFPGDQHLAPLVKPYTSMLLVDSLESLGVTTAAA